MKELVQKLVDGMEELFEDELERNATAAIAAIKEDGSVVYTRAQACHAGLEGEMNDWFKGTKLMSTYLRGDLSGTESFFDYLVNRSPYADAFYVKDVEFILENKMLIADCEAPANLITGGFLVSRLLTEHGGPFRTWKFLVSHGVCEGMALLVCQNFRENDDGSLRLRRGMTQHTPFQSDMMDLQSIKAFFESDIQTSKHPMKEKGYTTFQRIWHEGESHKREWLWKKLQSIVNGGILRRHENNPFYDAYRSEHHRDDDNVKQLQPTIDMLASIKAEVLGE